jgi:hypothetical protein
VVVDTIGTTESEHVVEFENQFEIIEIVHGNAVRIRKVSKDIGGNVNVIHDNFLSFSVLGSFPNLFAYYRTFYKGFRFR